MEIPLKINYKSKPPTPKALLEIRHDDVFKRKDITYEQLLKKSLENFLPNNNIKEKVRFILDIVAESQSIEVIQKSLVRLSLNRFLKVWSSNNEKDAILENIAFVIRVTNPEHLKKLNNKNGIIITVDAKKSGEDMGCKLWFDLNSIQIRKIPNSRYQHHNIIHLTTIRFLTDFNDDDCLLSKTAENYIELKNLKKALDRSEKNAPAKLSEWSDLTGSMLDFLKSKKTNISVVYYLVNNDKKQDDLNSLKEVKHNTEIEFVIKKPIDTKFDTKVDYTIGNRDDESDSYKLRLFSKKEFDILKFIKMLNKKNDDKINTFKTNLEQFNEEIKALNWRINKLNNTQNEKQEQEQELISNLKKLNQQASHIDEKNRSLDMDLKRLTKNSRILKSDLQKMGSKIKNKKKKTQILEIEKNRDKLLEKIDKLIEKFTIKKEEFSKIQEVLTKNNNDIDVWKGKLKKKSKEINILKQEKEGREKEFRTIENDKTKINKKIDDCKTNKIKFKEFEEEYEKEKDRFEWLKVTFTGREDERQKDKHFFIEKIDENSFFEKYKEEKYFLSDYNVGLKTKFERYQRTIKNIQWGNYKSPYAILSLDKPNTEIEYDKNVKINNISLNSKQKQAVQSVLNSHFASFLQGPPGTGKTQVISSLIENKATSGEITLISSSTNEAINNAMDRLNNNLTNPNLIFLRYSSSAIHLKMTKNFTAEKIYPNFINRIDGFIQNGFAFENKNQTKINNSDLNKIEKIDLIMKHYLPSSYYAQYIAKENDLKVLDEINSVIKAVKDEDVQYYKENLSMELDKWQKRIKDKHSDEFNWIESLVELHKDKIKFEKHDSLKTFFDKLKKNISSDKKEIFSDKIKKLSIEFKEKDDKWKEDRNAEGEEENDNNKDLLDFAMLAYDNELINIIGITTTSRQAIKIRKKEKQLFVEYPVNFAVVDEISKSITPEVLNISILADQFMFAGDYRQLPPNLEISEELCAEYVQYVLNNQSNPFHENVKNIFLEGAVQLKNKVHYDDDKYVKNFKEKLDKLFSSTLFYEQVQKMKRHSSSNKTSYVALNEQYRFGESINSLVNLTYDTNEKLKVAKNKLRTDFNQYETGRIVPRNKSVEIIDTSYLSDDFLEFIKNKNIYLNLKDSENVAFDTNVDLFVKNKQYNAKTNPFNAFVIKEYVKNLKEKNKKLQAVDIGIIAITRSQVTLLKSLFREVNNSDKSFFKSIKIDTVDNFQGREKDIIILDLVRAQNEFREGKIQIFKNPRNLEFYKKPERLNVAISRAKSKLTIVGAMDYLSKNVISKVFKDGQELDMALLKEWLKMVKEEGGCYIMKEFLNKNYKVNLPVPYLHIAGTTQISKIEEMSDLQKRLFLMLMFAEELEIEKLTLAKAIEKILGVKRHNLPLLMKDLKDLFVTKTIDYEWDEKKLIKSDDVKIRLITPELNPISKKNILDRDFYQKLTTKTWKKSKEMAIAIYHNIKDIEDIDKQSIFDQNTLSEVNLDFEGNLTFNENQKKDFLINIFSKDIGRNESFAESSIQLEFVEDKVIWINKDINFRVTKAGMMQIANDEQKSIMERVANGNIKIDLKQIINKNIERLNLQQITHTEDLIYWNKTINIDDLQDGSEYNLESRIAISNKEIHNFFYVKQSVNFNNYPLDLKHLYCKQIDLKDFIEVIPNLTPKLLKTIDKKWISKITNIILSKKDLVKKNQVFLKEYVLNHLPFIQIEKLNQEEFNWLYNSKNDIWNFINDNLAIIKNHKMILNMILKTGLLNEEKIYDLVKFEYQNNQRVFSDWKSETLLFKKLVTFDEQLENNKLSIKEIENIIIDFKKDIPELFLNQPIVLELIKRAEKIMELKPTMDNKTISHELLEARSKLEKDMKYNSKQKDLSFRKTVQQNIGKNQVDKIIKYYEFLSNKIHNKSDETNIFTRKDEDLLKEIIQFIAKKSYNFVNKKNKKKEQNES